MLAALARVSCSRLAAKAPAAAPMRPPPIRPSVRHEAVQTQQDLGDLVTRPLARLKCTHSECLHLRRAIARAGTCTPGAWLPTRPPAPAVSSTMMTAPAVTAVPGRLASALCKASCSRSRWNGVCSGWHHVSCVTISIALGQCMIPMCCQLACCEQMSARCLEHARWPVDRCLQHSMYLWCSRRGCLNQHQSPRRCPLTTRGKHERRCGLCTLSKLRVRRPPGLWHRQRTSAAPGPQRQNRSHDAHFMVYMRGAAALGTAESFLKESCLTATSASLLLPPQQRPAASSFKVQKSHSVACLRLAVFEQHLPVDIGRLLERRSANGRRCQAVTCTAWCMHQSLQRVVHLDEAWRVSASPLQQLNLA